MIVSLLLFIANCNFSSFLLFVWYLLSKNDTETITMLDTPVKHFRCICLCKTDIIFWLLCDSLAFCQYI